MASSSSSLSFPSSSLSRTWKHNVFPSFHGPDVHKAFLSHVLKEFRRRGINLFIDNEIKRGEFIGPELKQAIRRSKIAVVLLSKNYASSSWCLDELVEIMKNELVQIMMKKESGQTVITIFYEVDPTDVKKQKGDFGKVFKKTCKGKGKEKVKTWKKALEDVATIAGYHTSKGDNEATMIEKIAEEISNELNLLTPSRDFDRLIGMGAHMERMDLLLCLDLDEVRMIGIWGPPGIGKSTIARFLFNQVSSSFDNSALMVNIKGSYPRPCLDEYSAQLQLQKKMLSEMFDQKDIIVSHLEVAEGRLSCMRVLLVLDDVDQLAQLDALARNVEWFGPGSRIIITTEDLRLLKAHEIKHIYKVNFPSTHEALQIFCMYAFDQKSPKDGFDVLAREITYLVGELPLGLKVMGSYFRGLSKEQWSMEVSRLKTNLNGDIESILKFSYDALCDEDKDLFLHIACFFNYENIEKVEEFLAERFKNVRQRLYVLKEKSLLSIEYDDREEFSDSLYISMHNLLAQLGKGIARKESVRDPGKRQFLIDYKDICEVLTTITGSVTSIDTKYELNITEKAFEGMYNLEFLRVRPADIRDPNIISSQGPLTFISPKLRLLHWTYCPMTCLRFTNDLKCLVELTMFRSKLEMLWDGTKMLPNLKRMNLSFSRNLKELPNLSMATSLEELKLSECSSLVEIPSSIGNITNIKKLDLSECSILVELPSSIGNLTNLYKLDLSECSSLVELPSSIGNLINLKKLDLSKCSSLVELPSSIGNLNKLSLLYLRGCSGLVELPSSIGNLTNLQKLYLSKCSSLVELPSSIGNLTKLSSLYLEGCSGLVELPSSIMNSPHCRLSLYGCSSLVEIPSSIKMETSYNLLQLRECSSLVELPFSIGNLTNLFNIYLSECSSLVELPSSIGNLTNLKKLVLKGCSSLVSLPQLPDSLLFLNAENCVSLEKLDCSFCNPDIGLNFVNCFNLNKEARDLIIHTSTLGRVILPGKEVPAWFTYRASGSSVTVKLNQKPLHTSTKFKACILLVINGHNDPLQVYRDKICVYCTKKNKACILLDNKGKLEVGIQERGSVSCRIEAKRHGPFDQWFPILSEHLYIFEVVAEEVTSTELVFDFEFLYVSSMLEIKECGIIQLLDHHVDGDEEMCETRSNQL